MGLKMRSTWTDSRLDDLNDRVSELSSRVDGMNQRMDALQHTMIHAFIAIGAVMLTGFVGLAGLIVTQL
jgi:hypothetical protein